MEELLAQLRREFNAPLRRGVTLAGIGCVVADATFWLPAFPWHFICYLISFLLISVGTVLFLLGAVLTPLRWLIRKRMPEVLVQPFAVGLAAFGSFLWINLWASTPSRHGSKAVAGWPFPWEPRDIAEFFPAFFALPELPAAFFIAVDVWHAIWLGIVAGFVLIWLKTQPVQADHSSDKGTS